MTTMNDDDDDDDDDSFNPLVSVDLEKWIVT
jgi:hypothetical protein